MIGSPPRTQRATPAISAEHESRCLIFTGKDAARALGDPTEISELLKDEQNFVWFDLAEPTSADLALLQEEFSLHPTAIEDAALVHERPKIERYDDYWLLVLHTGTLDDSGRLVLHELAVFIGKNFAVTIRAHPVFPLTEIERRWQTRSTLQRGPIGLLYVILDVVVDAF
jgi:magnesium transporter